MEQDLSRTYLLYLCAGVNENIFAAWGVDWIVPINIPVGQYHYRVNVTNTTASVLSDTFQITVGQPDCKPVRPWTNITSTTDPNYRSLYITTPVRNELCSGASDQN